MARTVLTVAAGAAVAAGTLRRSMETPWFIAMMAAVCAVNVAAIAVSALWPSAAAIPQLMTAANSAAAFASGAVSFDLNCRSSWMA